MKKILLGTSALLGAGLVASPALAADGIKLSVGGFFNTSYVMNFDDNEPGELGYGRSMDAVTSNAEIHFKGETTLDNGVTVGARVELEGEQANDQIDEAYVYFSGGFGEVRIGSDDDIIGQFCLTAPGATANFNAFSPDSAGDNAFSNVACDGLGGDSQKLIYFSPVFGGFQFGLSYTPSAGVESHPSGAIGYGQPSRAYNSGQHLVSAGVNYNYEGEGWGLSAAGAASFEGKVSKANNPGGGAAHRDRAEHYQVGAAVNFSGFEVGGAFQYMSDSDYYGMGTAGDQDDAWTAGGGVAYNVDAFTVGLQYSHTEIEVRTAAGNKGEVKHDRVVLTGDYAMGPGVNLDAQLGYSWLGGAVPAPNDDYDAFEIGIGTSFKF